MDEGEDYAEYLTRHSETRGTRKKLGREDYNRLSKERRRLIARMDPDDIQLDEWKRREELDFLLILSAEDEE